MPAVVMMSSLARPPRVIRSAASVDDVVVLGGVPQRQVLPGVGPVATANEILTAADGRSQQIIADAEARAAAILAEAQTQAAAVAAAAREEGAHQGFAAAQAEAAHLLGLLQEAAANGAAIRDQIVGEAMTVITRAVLVAVRRIVGEYYDEDPSRTSAAISDALRDASNQEVVSIRVNPAIEPAIRAALVDVAHYVRPDDAIEVGGCLIDLRNGQIDATLDSRVTLMELAIRNASGEADA